MLPPVKEEGPIGEGRDAEPESRTGKPPSENPLHNPTAYLFKLREGGKGWNEMDDGEKDRLLAIFNAGLDNDMAHALLYCKVLSLMIATGMDVVEIDSQIKKGANGKGPIKRNSVFGKMANSYSNGSNEVRNYIKNAWATAIVNAPNGINAIFVLMGNSRGDSILNGITFALAHAALDGGGRDMIGRIIWGWMAETDPERSGIIKKIIYGTRGIHGGARYGMEVRNIICEAACALHDQCCGMDTDEKTRGRIKGALVNLMAEL